MNILTSLFSRALLAVALASGAAAAAAAPVYHVDLNLSTFSGAGFLDMQFNQAGEFAPATATLTGFGHGFGEYAERTETVTGSVQDGKIVFDNTVFNDLFQSVDLGGRLGFDITFDGPSAGGGSVFAVSLFDETGVPLVDLPLLQITVHPGAIDALPSDYATVGPAAAVPEPSAAALVLVGLLMAGAVARRRA